MKIGDAIQVVGMIIVILGILAGATFLVYSSIRYWEIKSVIKDCNIDFGEGNWVFIENSNYYTCKSTTQRTSITSSQKCLLNGAEINCSELDSIKW